MPLARRTSSPLILSLLLPLVLLAAAPALAGNTGAVTWPDNYFLNNSVVVMTTSAASVEDLTASTDVNLFYLDGSLAQGVSLIDAKNPNQLNSAALEVGAKVHIRGQSTKGAAKPQFAVKLEGDWPVSGANFLDMPYGGDEWVFNDCGAVDKVMLRNMLAFDMQRTLGENTGSNAWAPRTKYFEMFIVTGQTADEMQNKTLPTLTELLNSYAGVYLNLEKIAADPNRVDIPTTYAPPATGALGGLLLQLNTPSDDSRLVFNNGSTAIANTGDPALVEWPEADFLNTGDYATAIENWWYNPSATGDFRGWAYMFNGAPSGYITTPATPDSSVIDPTTYWNMVENYTDLNSFAEYFLLNEVAKDPDGYHRSTFMYRQPDAKNQDGTITPGKLYAGPLWDKNKSYANPDLNYAVGDYKNPEGWLFTDLSMTQAPWWWTTLSTYEGFQDAVTSAWTAGTLDETGAFSPTRIATLVQEQSDTLSSNGSYARDYQCYNGTAEQAAAELQTGTSDLITYLGERLTWLNENLPILGQAVNQ
ncbi:MAG: CotH kinase family protein [Deltaproteobacteria bacterium]|nr:CotH kinase family protein [Deltaproteobacteria bacterium]